jgi:hypothetical protein
MLIETFERPSWQKLMGIFIVRISLLGHKIQGFHFGYLPNTKFTWNQFKCEILNYDYSYGGGVFSHA